MGQGGTKPIPQDLDLTILDRLHPGDREKIESLYHSQRDQIESLNESLETNNVDKEQRLFELQTDAKQLSKNLDQYKLESTSLRDRLTQLEEKLTQSQEQESSAKENLSQVNAKYNNAQAQISTLEVEKKSLLQVLERKNVDLQHVDGLLKDIQSQADQARLQRQEALSQLQEAQNDETNAARICGRLEQEKIMWNTRREWLECELRQKVKEVLSIRQENQERILELESLLAVRQNKIDQNDEVLENLHQQIERLESLSEEQSTRLHESELQDAEMHERYQKEIAAQEKLITMYKDTTKEEASKYTALSDNVSHLKKMLEKAAQAFEDLKLERDKDQQFFHDELRAKDQRVETLELELKNANHLLSAAEKRGQLLMGDEEVEALAPAAAAVSKLLKAGMTLTEMYSEYVKTSEALLLEKNENEGLRSDLQEIVNSIEEKAPLVKQQREAYERGEETIKMMSKQMENAAVENERLRLACEEHSKKSAVLGRENKRLQVETSDLSCQVKMLMKELCEMQGTFIDIDTSAMLTLDTNASSRVISENLVSFRNIEELQEQNRKLLAVVRELSEDEENNDKDLTEKKMLELEEKLRAALAEMGMLKKANEKQMSLFESMKQQRDLYCAMSTQLPPSPQPVNYLQVHSTPMTNLNPQLAAGVGANMMTPIRLPQAHHSPVKVSPSVPNNSLLEETSEALKEIKEEFSSYRRERSENEKILTSQVDGHKEELVNQKLLNAKLSSELRYMSERFKTLQGNVEGYKGEITALRKNDQKMTDSLIKHESTIAALRQEMTSYRERASKAEMERQIALSECEQLRSCEMIMRSERDSLQQNTTSQELVLLNLQAIQNNLQRSDFEKKSKFEQNASQLERENTQLLQKIDELQVARENAVVDLQRNSEQLIAQREAVRVESERLQRLNEGCVHEVESLKEKLAAAEMKLESQMSGMVEDTHVKDFVAQTERLKNKEREVTQLKAEIQSLGNQLGEMKNQTLQFQKMSDAAEAALFEANKVANQAEVQLSEQKSTYEEEKKVLQEQLQKLSEEKSELERQHQSSELIDKLQVAQTSLSALEEAHSGCAEEIQKLQLKIEQLSAEREEQFTLATESQQKYQRELVQHAHTMEKYTAVKNEVDSIKSLAADSAEKLEEEQKFFKLEERLMSDRLKKFQEDFKEREMVLEKKNDEIKVLQTQLCNMTEQMLVLQKRVDGDVQELSSLSAMAGDGEQGRVHLLELIRHIRKEKDVAEAQKTIMKAEKDRHQANEEHLAKTNSELLKEVNQLHSKLKEQVQTLSQQAELLRKVDQLNILTDSNNMLRIDKERLTKQLAEVQGRLQTATGTLSPLEAKVAAMSEEISVLNTNIAGQKMEIEQWRKRTNHLVEQCNKVDPEEQKQLVADKANLERSVKEKEETINKLRLEADEKTAKIEKIGAELKAAQQEGQEKESNNTKLRELGRTLRTQVRALTNQRDELRKELEQAKRDLERVKAQLEGTSGHAEAVKTLEGKIGEKIRELTAACTEMATLKENIKTLNEKVESQELNADGKLQENNKLKSEVAALSESLKKKTEELQEMAKEKESIEVRRGKLQENTKTLREKFVSFKEENTKLRMSSEEKDKLIQEKEAANDSLNKLLEEATMRENLIKTKYESQIARLKHQDSSSPHSSAHAKKPTVAARAEVHRPDRTANIRPIQQRPRTVSTASIRPQQAAVVAQATPTATVQPVHVQPVLSDSERGTDGASSQQHSSSTAMTVETTSTVVAHSVPHSVEQSISLSSAIDSPSATRFNVSDIVVGETTAVVSAVPHTEVSVIQSDPPPTSSASMADDVTKISEAEEEVAVNETVEQVMPAVITVTASSSISSESVQSGPTAPEEGLIENSATSTQDLDGSRSIVELEKMEDAVELAEVVAEEECGKSGQKRQREEDDDEEEGDIKKLRNKVEDAAEVEVEEEENIEYEEGMDESEEESELEEVEEEDEEEEENDDDDDEEEEEEEDEGDEQELDEDEDDNDDQDCIVLSDDDASNPMQGAQPSNQGWPSTHPATQRLAVPPQSLAGFEDHDEGIVPSTPTLTIPRNSDGFAEAISSPQVNTAPFQFMSSGDSGQLAEQTTGVEATSVDLSSLEQPPSPVPATNAPDASQPSTSRESEASRPRIEPITWEVTQSRNSQERRLSRLPPRRGHRVALSSPAWTPAQGRSRQNPQSGGQRARRSRGLHVSRRRPPF